MALNSVVTQTSAHLSPSHPKKEPQPDTTCHKQHARAFWNKRQDLPRLRISGLNSWQILASIRHSYKKGIGEHASACKGMQLFHAFSDQLGSDVLRSAAVKASQRITTLGSIGIIWQHMAAWPVNVSRSQSWSVNKM